MADRILTEKEAAAYLNLQQNTLNRWRMLNAGPDYSRIGIGRGTIRYRQSILDDWLNKNEKRIA